MKLSQFATAMAAACIAAYPATVLANDSTLVLVMGGEAYDGPPKFEVDFDGKPLGEGTVAAAIDTVSVGRFADAADKTPYIQTFTFTVPEAMFRPDGEVTVKFLNEAYGGEGSNHDRNLYLASVSLNGRAVTASGLTTRANGAMSANEMLDEFVVLPDGNSEGISKAPKGGWPSPVTASGAARTITPGPTVQIADVSSDPLPAAAMVKPKLAAVAPPEPEESMATAALDPNPEAVTLKCDLDEIYNVIGFNENSNELTPKLVERLDQVASDIGDRQCNVQVTGYSSKQGAIASNALFAVERAQNSLRYLQQHGVKFTRASATGVGATEQFGPDFSSNRRVVITVTP